MKYLIISYVPLLEPIDYRKRIFELNQIDQMRPILNNIENADNHVEGIAWSISFEPIFIMDKAKDVAQHIEFWSDQDPASWFELHWWQDKDKYAIILMPKYEKSIERNKVMYHLITGQEIPNDVEYQIISKPLCFISQNATTFNKIKHRIASIVRIGFIENLEDTEPYWLSDQIVFKKANHPFILNLFEGEDK